MGLSIYNGIGLGADTPMGKKTNSLLTPRPMTHSYRASAPVSSNSGNGGDAWVAAQSAKFRGGGTGGSRNSSSGSYSRPAPVDPYARWGGKAAHDGLINQYRVVIASLLVFQTKVRELLRRLVAVGRTTIYSPRKSSIFGKEPRESSTENCSYTTSSGII